ncbi:transposable element Tcb2 transposase [Trichonephila clavipes]|uniref:Transposable element Tcb2 transposase n=1 Tax=Trichonephila clavipes TaxID=2585209 RepID=A0A8X7BHR6_TRICX|nr:transposable element Tcb2 transposase [Trichonephila clavipes]
MLRVTLTARYRNSEMNGAKFLFSYESHFSVHPDNRRIFSRWKRVTSKNCAFVIGSVIFDGGGLMVYASISIDDCTDPHINRVGVLFGRRYKDVILRPIVVSFNAEIKDDVMLMDDDCNLYCTYLNDYFLFEEGITRMEWSAC